jgi:hypothetical protein
MPIRAGRPNGGEFLDGIGVPVVAEFPKPLTDEVVQAAELLIIMGCGDGLPDLPRPPLHGVASGRLHRTTPGGRTPHLGRYRRLRHLTLVLLHRAGCAGEFPLSEANRPVIRLLSRVVTAGRCRSCLGVSEGRWRREGEADESAVDVESSAVGGLRHAPVANAEEPIGYREPFRSRSKIIMRSRVQDHHGVVVRREAIGCSAHVHKSQRRLRNSILSGRFSDVRATELPPQ